VAVLALVAMVPRGALAAEPAAAAPPPPARELLARAEALNGSGGTYDPKGALPLFEQAAAGGDPMASYRLALQLHLRHESGELPGSEPLARAATLYARSAKAVETMAATGDAMAQEAVGTARIVGLAGAKDLVEGRRLLELAAAQGRGWAWYNLGFLTETGRGIPADRNTALAHYRRGAETGNVAAMAEAGRLLLNGRSSGAPCKEGIEWLDRSARAGSPCAAQILGLVLYPGLGTCVAPEPARGLELLERAVAAGETEAENVLAVALLAGDGGRRDVPRAIGLLERAAGRDERFAIEMLAFLHGTGVAGERSPAKVGPLMERAAVAGSDGYQAMANAVVWTPPLRRLVADGVARLRSLAARGDGAAAAMLVRLFVSGHVPDLDDAGAAALARTAADAGEAYGMRILARSYVEGSSGLAKDPAEGLRWWRRCAETGDSFCMMFYGKELASGEIVAADVPKGVEWLTRAGDKGNYWAIASLGNLYDQGWFGLPRDEAKAAPWKRLAAKRGDKEARGWLLYRGLAVE